MNSRDKILPVHIGGALAQQEKSPNGFHCSENLICPEGRENEGMRVELE